MIHQILGQHRALEARWHAARLQLHQRLALLLYKEDCKQVCFFYCKNVAFIETFDYFIFRIRYSTGWQIMEKFLLEKIRGSEEICKKQEFTKNLMSILKMLRRYLFF